MIYGRINRKGGGMLEKKKTARPKYYNTCEMCGAHLDPGERCDCRKIYSFMIARTGAERCKP